MAISQFDKDIEVIQKLDDEPNDVQGLTPAELKKRFDQAAIWLKEYINSTLIPAITGDGASGGGASNIGASVDDFPGNTVQDVLDAFNDALIARYTKAEVNAYVGQETNDLVASVSVNLDTGVITVTKKDGTQDTFDTALEKVPATMALVDDSGKTYLVITNQDGSQTRTDVSKLIDTYTFVNSSEVSFSLGGSGNNRTVTASIRPNSIGPDRFTLEVTQALEQYNAESAASAEAAAASEQAAKTSEINAKKSETASKESADTAIQKSSEAERSAENANLSAGSAAESANVAQRNAGEALGAKNAAIQAQKSIENMQVSANTLPAGTEATVTKTVEDGTVKLNFGLPQGADGGAIAADGLWGVRVDENGDLILTYVGDNIPPLSINEDGDLIYTLDGNEVNLGHVVGGDGGGGTTDYNLLLNKPSINGIPLHGNLTTEELGIRDGQDGAPGADGAPGPEGPPGQAATVEIAETETVEPGTPAAMVELPESTPQARRYKAQVPQGIQGPAGAGVPPTDDVPTDYLLSVGGWVPPPSGGSSGEVIFESIVTGIPEYRVTDIDFDTNVVTIDPPYEGKWGFAALTVCVKPEDIKDFESGVPAEIKALYGGITTHSHQLLDSTHIQFPAITKMDAVNLDSFYLSKATLVDAINLPAFSRARICISLKNGGTFGYLGLKNGNSNLSGVVYSLSGKTYGYYAESKLRGLGYTEIIVDGNQIYTLPCEYLEASENGVLSVKTEPQHTYLIKPDTVFNGLRLTVMYGGFVNGASIKIIKER